MGSSNSVAFRQKSLFLLWLLIGTSVLTFLTLPGPVLADTCPGNSASTSDLYICLAPTTVPEGESVSINGTATSAFPSGNNYALSVKEPDGSVFETETASYSCGSPPCETDTNFPFDYSFYLSGPSFGSSTSQAGTYYASICSGTSDCATTTFTVVGPSVLTSQNPATSGCFGCSVAVSSGTVVVGAPYETETNAGDAYIFTFEGGSWTPTTLTSANPSSSGEFGKSVAAGDGLVFVGAPYETSSDGYGNAGNVYVYDATGTLLATLDSPNQAPGGEFGYSLVASGSTIVVGAPGETSSGGDVSGGNAYVCTYDSTDNTCTWTATLTSPNPQSEGDFGWSVATDGSTILVGAPQETDGQQPVDGNAYAFSYVLGGWTASALTNPDPLYMSMFGTSVAVSGDTAAVGTTSQDAVNVFTYGSGSWTLAQTLLGSSVAMSGDTLVIGDAQAYYNGFSGAGSVYVFNVNSLDVRSRLLVSPNAQDNGAFGDSVGVSGGTIVVGAPDEESGATSGAGNAYIFLPPLPSIDTLLSATTIPVGGSVTDSATLSGVTSDAGGTVTYSIFDSADCSGAPASGAGVVTVTDGVVPSYGPIAFTTAGSYGFDAVYSGDSNNPGPVTSLCEPLTVEATASLTDSVGITDTLIPPPPPNPDAVSLGDSLTSACAFSPTQDSCGVPVIGGTVFSDQTSVSGVSVSVTGTSGASAMIETQNLGSSQPSGTGSVPLSNTQYYDVKASGISGGTATICITPSNGANSMEYYDTSTSSWVQASSVTYTDNTICGQVPVDSLTGTYFVTGVNFVVTSEVPGGTITFVAVAALTLVLVGVVARKRKREDTLREP